MESVVMLGYGESHNEKQKKKQSEAKRNEMRRGT